MALNKLFNLHVLVFNIDDSQIRSFTHDLLLENALNITFFCPNRLRVPSDQKFVGILKFFVVHHRIAQRLSRLKLSIEFSLNTQKLSSSSPWKCPIGRNFFSISPTLHFFIPFSLFLLSRRNVLRCKALFYGRCGCWHRGRLGQVRWKKNVYMYSDIDLLLGQLRNYYKGGRVYDPSYQDNRSIYPSANRLLTKKFHGIVFHGIEFVAHRHFRNENKRFSSSAYH